MTMRKNKRINLLAITHAMLLTFAISAILIPLFYVKHRTNARTKNALTNLCKQCINMNLFRVIISPKRITQTEFHTILLLMSSYRRDAFARRQAIRNTWGNTTIYVPIKMQRVFVLGIFIHL